MGIVTRRTVFDDPFACPIGDAFTVGAAHPIFFLSEMALTAHLVAVVHVYLHTLFGLQEITLILFVAGKTRQGVFLAAVIQEDITVSHFSGACNGDLCIIMA